MKSILIVLVSILGLTASELVVADLQFGLDLRPGSVDYRIADGLGQRSGSADLGTGLGLRLRAVHAPSAPGRLGGLLYGAELILARHDLDGDGHLLQLTPRLIGGWQQRLGGRWSAEATTALGYGLSDLEIDGDDRFAAVNADGHGWELAVEGRLHRDLGQRWRVSAGAGWLLGAATLTGDGRTIDLDQSGPLVSLTLSWRFAGRPAVLEP